MRKLLACLLTALCLASSTASASQFDAPVVIGSNSAGAGSAVLSITTTADCPPGALLLVAVGQTGSVTATSSVTDSASNTYNTSASTSGTLQRTVFYTTRLTPWNLGLPSGSTITVTYGTNTGVQLAQAICWTSARMMATASQIDVVTAGVTGASTNPATTPGVGTRINNIQFIATLLTAGGGDTWTESAGYTSITPVLATDALRVSYQFSRASLTPDAYSATNGASRTWTTIGASFFSQVCNISSTGGGKC